ncbi:MAG TPA: S8 family serine peptidase [Mycobacteriales bacterium]
MRRFLVLAVVAALLPLTVARGAVLPQDDAGSGGDAPNAGDPTFRVDPGRVYSGTIEGVGLDESDWYAFSAPAGATVNATASGVLGCLRVYDLTGAELSYGCAIAHALTADLSVTVPRTGTYYLAYSYLQPDAYRFSLGLDAPAPRTEAVEAEPLSSGGSVPHARPASPRDKHVVIAVVDTGINPYHEFFRAPALQQHPSTYLPGFPRSAQPVRLSLGAPDMATALAADEDTWASVQPSTLGPADPEDADPDEEPREHLYTFPGTRVVAGISFGEYSDVVFGTGEPAAIRDDYGHGTHSAGLAAGANLPESDANVLIVAVEVGQGSFETGILWAARQPWIDAITVSLGTRANAPLPAPSGPSGARTGLPSYTRQAYASGKPVFIAAGNGVSSTGVAPDKCTTYTSPYVGPVWVARIGAAASGSGNPTYWHCVPVEATARTNVMSPSYDSVDGASSASGTSAATPNAAGHWASLMLAARRGGARVSRLRALEYLLHAAAPPPPAPGASDPSAYPASLADQGYGLIDARAVDLARTAVLAGSGPAARPETAEWFARDREIRIELWGAPPEPETGT